MITETKADWPLFDGRIISQCFIDNYNRLFHFDDILSKILYNFVSFKSKKVKILKCCILR
ncbi:hypothetical protein T12_7508 [Trichinella patagoniensis]|uniref:Uncharacterized protein n=1 Tax=Trichinella patagoniensis TaxID=990121 RepID=A0A0V1A5Q9_9BILA|nr:hypothetical protein T12_7508 [Trichinella patagoniensis]